MELKLEKNYGLGFFSDSFRVLGAYMVCKREGKEFYLNSDLWTFGKWPTYFTSFARDVPEGVKEATSILEEDKSYTVAEYRKEIKEVMSFQPYLIEKAKIILEALGTNAVSIFIRRGDKLLGESIYIDTEYYVILALSKNPSVVFVQTDDFRAFQTIHNSISMKNPSIKVVTSCPHTKYGSFFYPLDMSNGRNIIYKMPDGNIIMNENLQYLSSNIPQKPLTEYTEDEIKEHVEEMLVGLIVCQNTPYVVLDHMSNTSRFIAFSRDKEGILAIEDLNISIDGKVRLMPPYNYTEDKYIRNPRFHSIYNEYI